MKVHWFLPTGGDSREVLPTAPDAHDLVYQPDTADEFTITYAKVFLGLAIGYLCMPFDLIPDFIPVLGHLDDAIIVPGLVYIALRFVPPELVAEHRAHVTREADRK